MEARLIYDTVNKLKPNNKTPFLISNWTNQPTKSDEMVHSFGWLKIHLQSDLVLTEFQDKALLSLLVKRDLEADALA